MPRVKGDRSGVYVCGWEQTPIGFRVWVKKHPTWRGEATTFDEACEMVSGAICDATGDGEAGFEFTPRRPKLSFAVQHEVGRLIALSPRQWAETLNKEEVWIGEPCRACGRHTHGRTDTPLEIGNLDSGADVGHALVRIGARTRRLLLSGEFLALLTKQERDSLTLRRVVRQRKTARLFHEVLAGPTISLVALRAELVTKKLNSQLLRCDVCNFENEPSYFAQWPAESVPYYFADRDLPKPLPKLLLFGELGAFSILMSTERWESMVDKKGARGLESYECVIVDADAVDATPARKSIEDPAKRTPNLPG